MPPYLLSILSLYYADTIICIVSSNYETHNNKAVVTYSSQLVGGVGAKENNMCLQRLCYLHNVSFATSKFVRFFMMTSSNGNIFRVTGHLCGEFAGPGEFPAQRRVSRSFRSFFDLSLNKRLSKQSRGWRFGTQSRPLWRHCNVGFQENSPGDVRLPLLYLEMTLSPVWVEIPQYC